MAEIEPTPTTDSPPAAPTTETSPFGPAHNWCDKECERCLLEPTCECRRRDRGRTWAHEQRGEDPNSPDVIIADIRYELERTRELIEEISRERGIDLTAPRKEPRSLLAERLDRACMPHLRAAQAVLDELPEELSSSEAAQILSRATAILFTKPTRIVAFLPSDGTATLELGGAPTLDPDRAWEGYANLLLLEHMARAGDLAFAQLEPSLSATTAAQFRAARNDLYNPLVAIFATIPDEARAHLRAVQAASAAPSPFCVAPQADELRTG